MSAVASFVAGRRTKWVVLGLWIVAFAVMMPLGSKLADETQDDTASFLPESAESTRVVEILDEEFDAGETTQGLIVYQRDGGLTAADREKIEADAEAVEALSAEELPLIQPPTTPFDPDAPEELVAPDESLAYTVLTVPTDFENAGDWGGNIRDTTGSEADGMRIVLTGDLGFSADAEEVFGELDAKLLLATVLLVLVLLGAIYRAVLVALSPLIVVFFAYTVAQGFIYLLAKSGATVSSNGTSILIVLMFGVGTDYCLLLVSRYREELRRIEDKHEAMAVAVRRAGPAILASGLTVSLAMLVLALADAQNTATLGPVAAIGVFSGMIAGLTLLPAVLTMFGRRGFWPRRSSVEYVGAAAEEAHPGLWRRFGDRVLQRPAAALAITVIVFVGGTLGLIAYKVDYSTTTFFKKSVDSVEGFKLLEQSFPAGLLAPTTLLVQSDDGPVTEAQIGAAVEAVEGVDGVASATPTGRTSRGGRHRQSVDVVLENDPYTKAALDIVPDIRASVERSRRGDVRLDRRRLGDLLRLRRGRQQRPEADRAAGAARDRDHPRDPPAIAGRAAGPDRQRDPLLPLHPRPLGAVHPLRRRRRRLRRLDPDLRVHLPGRPRDRLHDLPDGAGARGGSDAWHPRGHAAGDLGDGPVITSAGLILAGTFSVLMTLPVTFTFDLGFMVALGILLDTFIVRTIMVPAAVELLGDKIWWPSTAQAGGALSEDTGEHPVPTGRS